MSNIHQKQYDGLPYRLGVGMVILNRANLIFIGKRIDTKIEAWQMPQGGIDIGETPSAAVMREMHEEIGTNNGYIIAESKYWYQYDLPTFLISKLWDGQFRGQRQRWFVIRFTGVDADININNHNPEFNEWRWAKIEELSDIIVPFKRKLYNAVVNEFHTVFSSKL